MRALLWDRCAELLARPYPLRVRPDALGRSRLWLLDPDGGETWLLTVEVVA